MIAESDLKLMKSERLSDFPDGGGRMTGSEVVSGEVNNLFPDISELDRVYGRVSLRKGFVGVFTDNVDTCYGMHMAVTDPPDDGNVNVCAFTRENWSDERTDAKDRIESYVISGPESRFQLYGDHLTGQGILRVLTDAAVSSPDIGEVFRLSIEAVGYSPEEQYIRVQAIVSRETQEFTAMIGDQLVTFSKDVLLLELSSGLRIDFPGGAPTKLSANGSPTKMNNSGCRRGPVLRRQDVDR